MKLKPFSPKDLVFWHIDRETMKPLTTDISTDVVVVGGGMAGLTAAQHFRNQGHNVVLIEKDACGSGASGKSSGFITPDSELSLDDIINAYGPAEGKKLWEFIKGGVTTIKKNIQNYNIVCDYQVQDTLVVANTTKAYRSAIEAEHTARQQLGYASTLYTSEQLPAVLGSHGYKGGVRYSESFGINGYRYCRGMKQALQNEGVHFYEETPMIALDNHKVTTPRGSITADHIIVCTDHLLNHLPSCADKIYHAQTFLLASYPLSDKEVHAIFPDKPCMVWDTDLIYNYYRLTGDNRLLLGGASLWQTYAKHESLHSTAMLKKLTKYFAKKFPNVALKPEYIWPGLIGISKDLFPIAGFDKDMPSVYYISAAAGLPWAAALGAYSAQCIAHADNPFNDQLSPYRKTPLSPFTEKILGTRLSFALSNFLSVQSM